MSQSKLAQHKNGKRNFSKKNQTFKFGQLNLKRMQHEKKKLYWIGFLEECTVN